MNLYMILGKEKMFIMNYGDWRQWQRNHHPLLMEDIFYKHQQSGQPDDALAFSHNSPSSWKRKSNMQLLCTRWTWLIGKHVIKGFFIFFRRWPLSLSNIPFSSSLSFCCINNSGRFMMVKKYTMYCRRWLLITESTDPSEMLASLDQAKHKEHWIAASLALEIFFQYSWYKW